MDSAQLREAAIKAIESKQEGKNLDAAIFGSVVSKEIWEGSDINVLFVTNENCPATSSITNYLYADLSLNCPAIEKINTDGFLVQTEYIPKTLIVKDIIFDWVLCDRLYFSEIIHYGNSDLQEVVGYIQSHRFTEPVIQQRIQGYLNYCRKLLDSYHTVSKEDYLFNLKLLGMFLGCAWIEKAKQPKKSYKKLLAQFQTAINDHTLIDDLFTVMSLNEVSKDTINYYLKESEQVLVQLTQYFKKEKPYLMDSLTPNIKTCFQTTMQISNQGVPQGKGIVENYQLGNYPAALDCLRKAIIWFVNGMVKINYDYCKQPFNPLAYLASLNEMPYRPEGLVPLMNKIFGSESPEEVARKYKTAERLLRIFEGAL